MIKIIPLMTIPFLIAASGCGPDPASKDKPDPNPPLVITITAETTFGTAMKETYTLVGGKDGGGGPDCKIVRWKYNDSELSIPVAIDYGRGMEGNIFGFLFQGKMSRQLNKRDCKFISLEDPLPSSFERPVLVVPEGKRVSEAWNKLASFPPETVWGLVVTGNDEFYNPLKNYHRPVIEKVLED